MRYNFNTLHLLLFLLIFPNVVFLLFWYKWFISVPTILLIIYLVKKSDLEYLTKPKYNSPVLNGLTLLASIYLTVISGTCNLMPQTFDFIKHHLIMADLVNFKWPVTYDDSYFLSYNIAYYLIPSGIAKLFSKGIAEYLLFIQLILIIFIALRYIQHCVTKNPYYSFLIIILPNSFFLLRYLFIGIGFTHYFKHTNLDFLMGNYLFEKPLYMEVSTLITQVVFVPQHLSTLLIAGCLMHYAWITKNIKLSFLVCCFTLLWSVFIFVALFMIFIFQLVMYYKKVLSDWVYSVSSIFVFLILVSYYIGHPTPDRIFFWERTPPELLEISIFILCIMLPYFILFFFIRKDGSIDIYQSIKAKYPKVILPLICGSMVPVFFLFYQFDFMLRGTSTFLFFLNLTVLSQLHKLKPLHFYVLVFIFSCSGIIQLTYNPVDNIIKQADKRPYKDYHYYLTNNKTIYDIDSYHTEGMRFQYISGTQTSFYYKYLAKKP